MPLEPPLFFSTPQTFLENPKLKTFLTIHRLIYQQFQDPLQQPSISDARHLQAEYFQCRADIPKPREHRNRAPRTSKQIAFAVYLSKSQRPTTSTSSSMISRPAS